MRHPVGLTTWLVASLAIGMTVVITAFAFLVALLIGPFPRVVQQWRLLRISMSENCGRPDCWRQMASPDEFAALQRLTGLNGVSAYTFGQVTAVAPEIASMPAAFVSPTYFDVLGVRAVIGRVFSASDEAGRVPLAMLSHRTWTRGFGSDPGAIGRTIRVADTFVEIVGVTPEFFVGIDLKSARGDNAPPSGCRSGSPIVSCPSLPTLSARRFTISASLAGCATASASGRFRVRPTYSRGS